jgi:hypothetical protein
MKICGAFLIKRFFFFNDLVMQKLLVFGFRISRFPQLFSMIMGQNAKQKYRQNSPQHLLRSVSLDRR